MCFFFKKKYLFTWLCWILDAACRIYFPDKGLNLDPLHWEYRVLATGQLRISLEAFLLIPGFCKSQFSWLLWLLLLPAFPQGIFPKEPSSPAWAPSSHLPMLLVLTIIFLKKNFFNFIFLSILYWFCHTSTWIHHGCTRVPHPEPPFHLPPHTPSGSSQCTSPKHPVSCIKPRLVIHFLYDIIHVSMPFTKIIPPSPSPIESKRLFYTSVSLLLSCIQDYHHHLSKFHIYVC